MKDFKVLAQTLPSENYKKIFEMLGDVQAPALIHEPGWIADASALKSAPPQVGLPTKDLEKIRSLLWEEVNQGTAMDGEQKTMKEVRDGLNVNMDRLLKQLGRGNKEGMAADAFFNDFSGFGTGIDPGSYNNASIPVVVSPTEATSYYSNGGIAATVIDKKSRGIFTNGYQFVGGLEEDELKELKDYADKLNFTEAVIEWWRDGWIYGGSLLLPWLKGDNTLTHEMSIKELAAAGMLKKDCIQYFWTADRWNSVLIPNYNISARDFKTPEDFYIPLAGLSVKTQRMSIGRPKQLPYWGMIRQMGWGISDFPSFMPSLLAYEIMIKSIPIISQQLSLVYLHQPLDAVIAQSGMNAVRKIQEQNQIAIDQWSQLRTQVLNLAGDIKSIERHFTDFDKLILIGKQDVGAKSGIPHTVLFNEQTASLDEKSFDTTLKQAETIKLSANQATLQSQNTVKFLVWSKWGYDSPQGKKADQVRLSLDSPVVETNEENIAALGAVGTAITAFTTAGFQLGDAVEMVRKFIPKFEPDDEMAKRIEAQDDAELDFQEQQQQQTLEIGKEKTDSTEEDDEGTGNPPTPGAATTADAKPSSWMDLIFRRDKK